MAYSTQHWETVSRPYRKATGWAAAADLNWVQWTTKRYADNVYCDVLGNEIGDETGGNT